MNTCNTKNNLLFMPQDEQSVNTFYERCLAYTKEGKIILLFTDKNKDLLKILRASKLSETELKRFVIINIHTLDACIQKLCELHDWAWKPSLIIVDLRTILPYTALQYSNKNAQDLNSTEALANPPDCFQQLALCIANLFEYQETILKRLKKQTNENSNCQIYSVLIANEHAQYLTSTQIDLLINLYFYKNNAFDCLEEILAKIAAVPQKS